MPNRGPFFGHRDEETEEIQLMLMDFLKSMCVEGGPHPQKCSGLPG